MDGRPGERAADVVDARAERLRRITPWSPFRQFGHSQNVQRTMLDPPIDLAIFSLATFWLRLRCFPSVISLLVVFDRVFAFVRCLLRVMPFACFLVARGRWIFRRRREKVEERLSTCPLSPLCCFSDRCFSAGCCCLRMRFRRNSWWPRDGCSPRGRRWLHYS